MTDDELSAAHRRIDALVADMESQGRKIDTIEVRIEPLEVLGQPINPAGEPVSRVLVRIAVAEVRRSWLIQQVKGMAAGAVLLGAVIGAWAVITQWLGVGDR